MTFQKFTRLFGQPLSMPGIAGRAGLPCAGLGGAEPACLRCGLVLRWLVLRWLALGGLALQLFSDFALALRRLGAPPDGGGSTGRTLGLVG